MKIFKFLIVILSYNLCSAQLSSDYFPTSMGFKWHFKLTPLDTLSNPIEELSTTRLDTFAIQQNYNGKFANIICSKYKHSPIFTDTNYIHLETTNGWLYTKLFPNTDSIPIFDTLGLTKFFRNFIGWHNYFRFAQPINIEYTIASKDTNIIINGSSYKVRVKIAGRRLNDEYAHLPSGSFYSKKFLIKYSLNYLLLSVEIPIILIPDTNWISNKIWIVKKHSPPVKIDLSALNLGKYFLNGLLTELQEYSPLSVQITNNFSYKLYQNYPNPFNSRTIIRYEIPEETFVQLQLYSIDGRLIKELVNSLQPVGFHEVTLNAENLSTGLYIYRISTRKYSDTKKTLLIK